MSHADEGRCGQAFQQLLVNHTLGIPIKRAGRLVQKEIIGFLEQGASGGNALLLTWRKAMRPVGTFA